MRVLEVKWLWDELSKFKQMTVLQVSYIKNEFTNAYILVVCGTCTKKRRFQLGWGLLKRPRGTRPSPSLSDCMHD